MSIVLSEPEQQTEQGRQGALVQGRAWYCVRTQPKHEHIVAASLRLLEDVEVFNPRIRQRRLTRRGPVWFTEALFPNYVFARFELEASLASIRYAMGVSDVVHFGGRWPTIADSEVAALQECMAGQELKTFDVEFSPGDEVTLSEPAFYGVPAVVLASLPAKKRVKVLLDILGRQTIAEVSWDSVVPVWRNPAGLKAGSAARAA
jgi:transcriptional antiterminator RfaH